MFRDGKDLGLIDSTERELARRNGNDLNARPLTDAFTAHGYPWTDTNPHEGMFTRWTDGHPTSTTGPMNSFVSVEVRCLTRCPTKREIFTAACRIKASSCETATSDRNTGAWFERPPVATGDSGSTSAQSAIPRRG